MGDPLCISRDLLRPPEGRTLAAFLSAALRPVGQTLYVYGGGWDLHDQGSGPQSVCPGLSPTWGRFFRRQDAFYDYRLWRGSPPHRWNPYYYAGLDCSGYVGWAVYSALYAVHGAPGFVYPSTSMARSLAGCPGLGTWTVPETDDYLPGDIVSIDGHIWICLGRCPDGSLVILHSTPSLSRAGRPGGGVQLSGLGRRPDCQATRLAQWYMETRCPAWSLRYPAVSKPWHVYTQFTAPGSGRFRWDLEGGGLLSDPHDLVKAHPIQILSFLGSTPLFLGKSAQKII